MGWLWSSKGASDPITPVAQTEVPAHSDSSASTPPLEPATNAAPTPQPQTLSRDQQSELEWAELIREFQAEESSQSAKRIQAKQADPPLDVSPDSLYPTNMSCQSAFDYAMFCSAFGGQFVNIYRYGEFRSCSHFWDEFWLCMRTRSWPEADRARAVQEHYKKKAIKYKIGPSSEDVWQIRDEPLKDAMQANYEEFEARKAAWKAANPHVPDPFDQERQIQYHSAKKG